jgi:nicotinate-nucleotide pyrophosphorylase (carboxylating)
LAGVPFFDHVFELVGCSVEWHFQEGSWIDTESSKDGKVIVAKVTGKARHLLLGERPALNALARASGIATRARKLREIKEKHGWHGIIAGTRKTTPGMSKHLITMSHPEWIH